ncbi:MAG: hypothetical protein JXB88_09735 [Spirochaetales bacterium]|nr:hypothetical protein [Spirochaetales bacterium]
MSFSLLWPGQRTGAVQLCPQAAADLDTDKLIQFISLDKRSKDVVQGVFSLLCQDCETVNYRLDIIDDLLHFPALIESLYELMPEIGTLRFYVSHSRMEEENVLLEVVWRLRELEYYVKCIQILNRGLKNTRDIIKSEGLKKLALLIDTIEKNPVFVKLIKELPELLKRINNLKSITIGVNLNAGLIPCEATLISINDKRFTDAPLWAGLFDSGGYHGIARLHSAGDYGYENPLMIPLFEDIAHILQRIARPLARSLKKFISINSRLLIKLQQDFLFYLGAVHIIKTFHEYGLPMIRPTVLEKEKRESSVKDLYNINLAIHMYRDNKDDSASSIVKNDFLQDESGRIIILTGPNRGGKTTFLQAVGLAQILMQVGLYVPAKEAIMSISDNIFTHYPAKEELEKGTGRFGEEAQRLHSIFNSATRFSLILLNESLSSTSIGESLYLAQDIVRVLRMLGTRVIYTTHLHELAAMIDTINKDTKGESWVMSMVALVEKIHEQTPDLTDKTLLHTIKPTFKIVAGPPMGHSFAIELASKFGISRDQLISKLKARGQVLPED